MESLQWGFGLLVVILAVGLAFSVISGGMVFGPKHLSSKLYESGVPKIAVALTLPLLLFAELAVLIYLGGETALQVLLFALSPIFVPIVFLGGPQLRSWAAQPIGRVAVGACLYLGCAAVVYAYLSFRKK